MKKILLFAAIIAASLTSKPVFAGIHGTAIICPTGVMNLCADSMAAGGNGIWSISDTTIANFYGLPPYSHMGQAVQVRGITAGTTTLTYTQTTGYATITVTVTAAAIPVTITGKTTIPVGSSVEMRAQNAPSGCFSSSNTAVATVVGCNDMVGGVYSQIKGVATGTSIISYVVGSGCATSSSTTTLTVVPAVDCISGTVINSAPYWYGQIKVWLIKYDPSTHMLIAVDSSLIGSTGHFQFCGMGSDSFRVKASEYVDPAMLDYYNFVSPSNCPTYYVSNSYWNTATTFYHTMGTNDTGKNITLISGTAPGGPGFIGGDVTTGANKGTSGGAAAPYMLVYCLNSATGAVVQHTYTDFLGRYQFSNLAVGQTYKIYPELLSYGTTPYPGITLTSGAPSMEAASFVQHTISHTITPVTAAVPGISEASLQVNVFPNPADGMVNIYWSGLKGEKAEVFITDITGRRVYATTINNPQENGREVIDISSLAKGLFYLTVKTGDYNYNTKLERL